MTKQECMNVLLACILSKEEEIERELMEPKKINYLQAQIDGLRQARYVMDSIVKEKNPEEENKQNDSINYCKEEIYKLQDKFVTLDERINAVIEKVEEARENNIHVDGVQENLSCIDAELREKIEKLEFRVNNLLFLINSKNGVISSEDALEKAKKEPKYILGE